jgi:hypothetical protein
VTGTGPLGCVPAELALRSTDGQCSAELQRAASLFNPQLVQMLRGLNSRIGSDVFVGVNTQQVHNDFINNPQRFGISFHHLYIYIYITILLMFPLESQNKISNYLLWFNE